MPASPYYSADAVRALPNDGNRYECAHGELFVTPAPPPLHQMVLSRIMTALSLYLAEHGVEATLTWQHPAVDAVCTIDLLQVFALSE